ncbi:copper amine oxidase N-terminal domain-containing protein [Paenibacillus sp. MWE-103]|uniref:Copper amine oxidase N-terminal domain-containing protein n=1 Tax=Paenibacillus artemisiicola TaxID=1172618 RepID=A0ABS3WA00_9BACL|nr:copper amine oxidase N-terminal domain-containing protein [Paenibacillus artemisiicola]MBO7745107.1 copper amine oxidase N-terminal domain-containing protein [Paenibacillus artemisiicola]
MKKMLVVVAAAAGLLAASATSHAAAPSKIVVGGKPVQLVDPLVVDKGRILVPLRALADSLGASTTWNQAAKTATVRKWSETSTLIPGKNTAYSVKANQTHKVTLDASVKLVHNRVYVPLRFLARLYGYRVAASGDTAFVNSPLTASEQDTLYKGELAKARQFAMDKGSKNAHYAIKPIPYSHEREGFETAYFFPIGEANRFFLITDDTVSFYEVKDDFFVVTWQARIPVGQKDTDQLFMDGKVTDAAGIKPEIKREFFFYRTSGLVTSTNITAGKIDPDGKTAVTGVKRIVGDEVKEASGSLALALPGEVRAEATKE